MPNHWNNLFVILDIPNDVKDQQLSSYFKENKMEKSFILYKTQEAMKDNLDITPYTLSFVKNLPKKFNGELFEGEITEKDIGDISFTIVDNIITAEIEIKSKKYSYIIVYNRDSFYPEYLFSGKKVYFKTNYKLNNTILSMPRYKNIVEYLKNGKVYKKLLNKYIFNMDKMKDWVIFTKEGCPFCEKAKKLLCDKVGDDNFEIVEINENNKDKILEETDQYTSGYRKVPMVFYYDNFVGGCDELEKLLSKA